MLWRSVLRIHTASERRSLLPSICNLHIFFIWRSSYLMFRMLVKNICMFKANCRGMLCSIFFFLFWFGLPLLFVSTASVSWDVFLCAELKNDVTRSCQQAHFENSVMVFAALRLACTYVLNIFPQHSTIPVTETQTCRSQANFQSIV